MRKTLSSLLAAGLLAVLPSHAEEGFVPLFDGKSLDNWTSARALAGGESAYSVNEAEKAIHVYAGKEADSKQETDCLNTKLEFSHFILKLEYKWLGKRFAPRADWDRDAGLLFHVHGDLKKVWPMSLEMQIGESAGDKPGARGSAGRFHSGDLFVLGKGLKVDTKGKDGHFHAEGKKRTGKGFPTKLGKEKPFGEWNEMEIQVHGSEKAVFILNSEVVHEITNFIQNDKDGKEIPLAMGRIGLQAEWAELMYRKIRIKELKPE
ncbi:DUF1080 domain-containing protein [Akkermansiaceae bacterium]|nr:DUF1080 domain-containing protein [Akkermansiaceae bacterium]MDC1405625.1 DUF1080 domain-containing protein [Akkermansiaceae bacterium]